MYTKDQLIDIIETIAWEIRQKLKDLDVYREMLDNLEENEDNEN